jgi:hypothetical protein
MTFTRRRKFVLAALLVYWPFIFFLTHIPQLPGWVNLLSWTGEVGLGDKTPHFLVYLGLVFLWWFTFYPYERVNWFGIGVYVSILALAVYGALDEWLQGFVHRSPDVHDFAADMAGVLTGLVLLTCLDFWLAAVVVAAAVLFASLNVMAADIVSFSLAGSTAFFLLGYAALTICWVNHLAQRFSLRPGDRMWLSSAAFVPLATLTVTHGYAAIHGRHHPASIIAALSAIAITLIASWIIAASTRTTVTAASPE